MTFQERMYKLETDLIIETIYQLQKGNIASANWYAQKLRNLGVLENKNKKIISEGFKDIEATLMDELITAQNNVVNELDSMATSLGQASRTNIDPQLKSILDTYHLKAMNDINQTGSTMIRQLNKIYIDAIDDIIASKLVTGEALQKTVKKVSTKIINSGVTCLIDKARREWSIEAYSNMVVRANTRQVSTQTQLTKFDEYNIDLVEISSHLGAREKCEPYQGKIYSRSGKHKVYPALSTTSKGEIDGLFGINCGHRMYPYIEGTRKTYKPYRERENNKAYEESQRQRLLERKVRQTKHDIQNSKRTIQLAEKTGDKAGVRIAQDNLNRQNALLRQRQANLRAYTKEVGRTLRPTRTTIY